MRRTWFGAAMAVMLVTVTTIGCTRGGGGGTPVGGAAAVRAGAVAVSDLARSVRFYTGLGMKQRSEEQKPGVDEVTVSFDGSTASLILQRYTDGRVPDAKRWPGKLVFGAANTTTFSSRVRSSGGQITSNAGIAIFGRDPDGYMLEINSATVDRINAFGIGGSNLTRTENFYKAVFGTTRIMSFNLSFNEYVVSAPGGGPALALMHWVDGSERTYQDNLGKLVFATTDVAGVVARVTTAGGTVVEAPVPDAAGGTVATAKDPDGTVLELRSGP
jgi:predicted enzyme related to lactoylglutathione lyase